MVPLLLLNRPKSQIPVLLLLLISAECFHYKDPSDPSYNWSKGGRTTTVIGQSPAAPRVLKPQCLPASSPCTGTRQSPCCKGLACTCNRNNYSLCTCKAQRSGRGAVRRLSLAPRLIQVDPELPPSWLSQKEISALLRNRTTFMDVTGRNYSTLPEQDFEAAAAPAEQPQPFPSTLNHSALVAQAIASVSTPPILSFVEGLSAFRNRDSRSSHGIRASTWLFNQLTALVNSFPSYPQDAVNIQTLEHDYPQNSVIVRITPASYPAESEPLLILGAHLDSISISNKKNSSSEVESAQAPGADDNGSGCAVLFESLRILLSLGHRPKSRGIEFHWYSGEERGLLGSGDVAADYRRRGVRVVAMINFDTLGYDDGSGKMAFVLDQTDPGLNAFLQRIARSHLPQQKIVNDICGYACSDHAVWNREGFKAAFPSENPLNPTMHDVSDTLANMSGDKVGHFVRLALGAIIELTA